MAALMPAEYLVLQLQEPRPHSGQSPPSSSGDAVPSARILRQPAQPDHARQQGIKGSRADAISMFPELLQHPIAHDGGLACMVQDVNLPKRAEDFLLGCGYRSYGHRLRL